MKRLVAILCLMIVAATSTSSYAIQSQKDELVTCFSIEGGKKVMAAVIGLQAFRHQLAYSISKGNKFEIITQPEYMAIISNELRKKFPINWKKLIVQEFEDNKIELYFIEIDPAKMRK